MDSMCAYEKETLATTTAAREQGNTWISELLRSKITKTSMEQAAKSKHQECWQKDRKQDLSAWAVQRWRRIH